MQDHHDPYLPPQAAHVPFEQVDDQLAGRWERLGASFLDGFLMMLIMLPAMWFGGFFSAVLQAARDGERSPMSLTLGWMAVSFILFVLIQGYPLLRTGQTWGKKLVGIRIVDLDGDVPALAPLLVKRYLVGTLLGQVPVLGALYGLTDALFVFRQDRRCIHDLIAGTQVVAAR